MKKWLLKWLLKGKTTDEQLEMIGYMATIDDYANAIKLYAWKQRYVDNEPSAKLVYAFTDSNGMKYSKYAKDEWMPIDRHEAREIRLQELSCRISREDLREALDLMIECVNKGMYADVASTAVLLKDRIEMLFAPDLMMRLISGTYIREDQINTAHIWNEELENEKFNQLMKDRQAGGLASFFQESSLLNHVPSLGLSLTDLEKMLQAELKEAQMFLEMIRKSKIKISKVA